MAKKTKVTAKKETTAAEAPVTVPAPKITSTAWDVVGFDVALKPIKVDGEEIPNRKAIVRLDTKAVLNIVTDRYKLVPHTEVFKPVREAIDRLGLGVSREIGALAMGGGYARFQWDFKGPEAVIEGDDILWRLTARNSYNYESKLDLELGAFRLVCSNGLRAPVGSVEYVGGKHLTGLNVDQCIIDIEKLLNQKVPVMNQWREWTEKSVDADVLEKRLEKVTEISAKAREEIVAYFGNEANKNVWTAYNAITWYATHKVGSRADRGAITQDLIQRRAVEFARKLAA